MPITIYNFSLSFQEQGRKEDVEVDVGRALFQLLLLIEKDTQNTVAVLARGFRSKIGTRRF